MSSAYRDTLDRLIEVEAERDASRTALVLVRTRIVEPLERERDALRAQVAELRAEILGLGKLEGPDEWLTDRGECIVRIWPSKRDAWNALVAKLRAEAKEEAKQ